MSSEHALRVGTTSDGAHTSEPGGRPVEWPVDELAVGTGLVTGQADADAAGTADRIVRELLDAGRSVVVVDSDGDFRELADHEAILHVGGDRTCDLAVDPSDAERVADLALGGRTSVLVDVQTFDTDGEDVVAAILEALPGGRRRDRSVTVVLSAAHEWLPADGSRSVIAGDVLDAAGRVRRGRDVGVLALTDQPADLRDDFVDACTWAAVHALTWHEDVDTVARLLGRRYTDAVEGLGSSEAFLAADWADDVRRVRFDDGSGRDGRNRSQTTDGTPDDGGLNLLADLPGARAPDERPDGAAEERGGTTGSTARNTDSDDRVTPADVEELHARLDDLESRVGDGDRIAELAGRLADAITEGLTDAGVDATATQGSSGPTATTDGDAEGDARSQSDRREQSDSSTETNTGEGDATAAGFGDVFGMFDDDSDATASTEPKSNGSEPASTADDSATAADAGLDLFGDDESSESTESTEESEGMSFSGLDFGPDIDESGVPDDFDDTGGRRSGARAGRTVPRYLRDLVRTVDEMDPKTRRMFAYYLEQGADTPINAHFSAGGTGDRTRAYAHNRQLRTMGFVEHIGRGRYAPCLRDAVVSKAGHDLPEHEIERAVDHLRQAVAE